MKDKLKCAFSCWQWLVTCQTLANVIAGDPENSTCTILAATFFWSIMLSHRCRNLFPSRLCCTSTHYKSLSSLTKPIRITRANGPKRTYSSDMPSQGGKDRAAVGVRIHFLRLYLRTTLIVGHWYSGIHTKSRCAVCSSRCGSFLLLSLWEATASWTTAYALRTVPSLNLAYWRNFTTRKRTRNPYNRPCTCRRAIYPYNTSQQAFLWTRSPRQVESGLFWIHKLSRHLPSRAWQDWCDSEHSWWVLPYFKILLARMTRLLTVHLLHGE